MINHDHITIQAAVMTLGILLQTKERKHRLFLFCSCISVFYVRLLLFGMLFLSNDVSSENIGVFDNSRDEYEGGLNALHDKEILIQNVSIYEIDDTRSQPISHSLKNGATQSLNVHRKMQEEQTRAPTLLPSVSPSSNPTLRPTFIPSSTPTKIPTIIPTTIPSVEPTLVPSLFPTLIPSQVPSEVPSELPSTQPSELPSTQPSELPSTQPSESPSTQPTTQAGGRSSLSPNINVPGDTQSVVPSVVATTLISEIPSFVDALLNQTSVHSALNTSTLSTGVVTNISRQPFWSTASPTIEVSDDQTQIKTNVSTMEPSDSLTNNNATNQKSGNEMDDIFLNKTIKKKISVDNIPDDIISDIIDVNIGNSNSYIHTIEENDDAFVIGNQPVTSVANQTLNTTQVPLNLANWSYWADMSPLQLAQMAKQQAEEIKNDKNVKVVAVSLVAVSLILLLCVAQQTLENPNGIVAKFFRCIIVSFRCICRMLMNIICCCYCCWDRYEKIPSEEETSQLIV